MAGRTLSKFERVYVSGYDLSGYGRSIGPLKAEYDLADLTAPMSDAVMGYLPNMISISAGTYNGVFQSTTDAGIEISAIQSPGVGRDVMVAIGQLAIPAVGDMVFACKSSHQGFHVEESGGAMYITADFSEFDASDTVGGYIPWGSLLHIQEAETAANSSTTDTVSLGSSSVAWGAMAWQVFSGDITGTVKIQHADSNVDGEFVDVTGLSGAIAIPGAGMVLATESIKPYVRWQLGILSGTTLTFAVALLHNASVTATIT